MIQKKNKNKENIMHKKILKIPIPQKNVTELFDGERKIEQILIDLEWIGNKKWYYQKLWYLWRKKEDEIDFQLIQIEEKRKCRNKYVICLKLYILQIV